MQIRLLAALAIILAGFCYTTPASAALYPESHPEYHPQGGDTWKKAYHPTAAESAQRSVATAPRARVAAATVVRARVQQAKLVAAKPLPLPPRFVPPPGPSARVLAEGKRSARLAKKLLPASGWVLPTPFAEETIVCPAQNGVELFDADSGERVGSDYWEMRATFEVVYKAHRLLREGSIPYMIPADCNTPA